MQWLTVGLLILGVVLYVGAAILNWIVETIDGYSESLAKAKAEKKWQADHDKWKKGKEEFLKKFEQEQIELGKRNRQIYEKEMTAWENECAAIRQEWDEEKIVITASWEKKKKEEKQKHQSAVEDIEKFKSAYQSGDVNSLEKYVELVLEQNHKNFGFSSDNNAKFIAESKALVVDCRLPAPEDMPTLKEVKFIKSKMEIKEMHLTDTAINKLYDDTIYQLLLSNVNQIFMTDKSKKIEAVIFNGWVHTIEKSTGKMIKACILSIQVSKEKFVEINLCGVDPKECFKHLKGVGSSKLYGITPIPPIMRISKDDKRFIESYDVAHTLNEGTNIAAMDWQDFEHLVREIFQKMFSVDGMEVKVTQSSRDKGVDAIAIDPNPVRGGRIVIQAKRYTNVVGISAVRDLYGTVMNEGAMKGILVTTSNFGNDSYEFVKGKPLTLISGGELLSLLSDHGYKARIDLKEAKKVLGEK